MEHDVQIVAPEPHVVLGFYTQLSLQRSHERLDEVVSGNCCRHSGEYLVVSRLVGNAFEVDAVKLAVKSARVVLVVGLGHVFLQEVFEVVFHRVSNGHGIEWAA